MARASAGAKIHVSGGGSHLTHMSRVTQAMLDELSEGYPDIPAGAVTVKEIAEAKGLTVTQARDRLDKLVAAGKWAKARRGVTCWYWKPA